MAAKFFEADLALGVVEGVLAGADELADVDDDASFLSADVVPAALVAFADEAFAVAAGPPPGAAPPMMLLISWPALLM